MENKDSRGGSPPAGHLNLPKLLEEKELSLEPKVGGKAAPAPENGTERQQSALLGSKSPEKIPSRRTALRDRDRSPDARLDARAAAGDNRARRATAVPSASRPGDTSVHEGMEDEAAVDTGTYRGGDVAARLRTARIAAGFASAVAAATHHGWGTSLYQHQESGDRTFTVSDVERFARAFNVTPRWIVTGQGDETERLAEAIQQASQERISRTQAAAGRLRLCRILRGFRTVSSAADRFGIKRTTLTSHELGSVDLSAEWASVYAVAFGVRTAWLTTGTLPSGLGERVDSYLEGAKPRGPDDAKDHAAALRHVSVTPVSETPGAIEQALKRLEATSRRGVPASKRRPPETVMVPEVHPTAFATPGAPGSVGSSLDEARRYPTQTWGLPRGYLSSVLEAEACDLLVVAADTASGAGSAVERYVVSTAAAALATSGPFVLMLSSGRLLIKKLAAGQRSVGETLVAEDREETGTLTGRLLMTISRAD